MKSGSVAPQRGSARRAVFKNWQLYLMLLPVVAFYLVFHYAPMYGVQIAFQNFNPVAGFWGSPWVGFTHFQRFFNSYYFGRLLSNTIILSLGQMLASTPVAILLALMINEVRHRRLRTTIQTITYAPHFISYVVMVGMLVVFTKPDTGLINHIIAFFGGSQIDFFHEAAWFRPLYIISGVWQHAGWNAIVYISALAGISPSLIEAARIDGAGRLRIIWHVNLPGILPTIVTLLILNAGSVMNMGYEKVYLMQNDLNIMASDVISTYTYTIGVLGGQYSYAAAVGLFNSVVNCVILVTVNQLAKRLSATSLW